MAAFYLLIRHAVTDGDSDALQKPGCAVVAGFQSRPFPPAAAAQLPVEYAPLLASTA